MTATNNGSGTEAIRQVLFVKNKKANLARLARDLGITAAALEAFCFGRAGLAPDVLVKLAPMIFDNAVYDPSSDVLRPAIVREPQPMGIKPEALEPWQLPTYEAGPPQQPPIMEVPPKPTPKRLGWVE